MRLPDSTPLVSVIIPCYNHSAYLQEAMDSVYKQTYTNVEVIVVDDGSTDNSKEVAQQYKEVKYFYRKNQGPAAARNYGIKQSTGDFLVFLDADDYLYPDAVGINLYFLQRYEHLAFSSGSHIRIFASSGKAFPIMNEVIADHYMQLLRGNYIGMPSTVMYRRWVFNDFLYDPTMTPCEDYDLYLRIARKYPVMHHDRMLAAYRWHDSNTSHNIYLMLTTAHRALRRQKSQLRNQDEEIAYAEGYESWKAYYLNELIERLRKTNQFAKGDFKAFLKYDPALLYHYYLGFIASTIKKWAVKHTPIIRVREVTRKFLK